MEVIIMRTTLVIPDPVCKRAKALARRQHKTFSELTAEALVMQLSCQENIVREAESLYRVRPVGMGEPRADVSNRDALYRCMEDDETR
jgi:adenine C2-methylase RlmN of 23S rRNA A2503 and tRNA A37